mgnify:CR=1 FL=1
MQNNFLLDDVQRLVNEAIWEGKFSGLKLANDLLQVLINTEKNGGTDFDVTTVNQYELLKAIVGKIAEGQQIQENTKSRFDNIIEMHKSTFYEVRFKCQNIWKTSDHTLDGEEVEIPVTFATAGEAARALNHHLKETWEKVKKQPSNATQNPSEFKKEVAEWDILKRIGDQRVDIKWTLDEALAEEIAWAQGEQKQNKEEVFNALSKREIEEQHGFKIGDTIGSMRPLMGEYDEWGIITEVNGSKITYYPTDGMDVHFGEMQWDQIHHYDEDEMQWILADTADVRVIPREKHDITGAIVKSVMEANNAEQGYEILKKMVGGCGEFTTDENSGKSRPTQDNLPDGWADNEKRRGENGIFLNSYIQKNPITGQYHIWVNKNKAKDSIHSENKNSVDQNERYQIATTDDFKKAKAILMQSLENINTVYNNQPILAKEIEKAMGEKQATALKK